MHLAALDHLLTDSDEEPEAKEALATRAEAIRGTLVTAGVLKLLDQPDPSGRTMHLEGVTLADLLENAMTSTPRGIRGQPSTR